MGVFGEGVKLKRVMFPSCVERGIYLGQVGERVPFLCLGWIKIV